MADKSEKKKPVRRIAERRSEGRDRHRQKDGGVDEKVLPKEQASDNR